MKLIRKPIALIVALVMMLCAAPMLMACGGGGGGGEETGDTVTYTVTLKRSSGHAFEGATVVAYDQNGKRVDFGFTDKNGTMTFEAAPGTYDLTFGGDFPKGYPTSGSISSDAPNKTFKLQASVIDGAAPSQVKYELGSVLYDFSWTDSTGKSSSLKQVLANKKAVLINFWYTTCTWCLYEFPDMITAYKGYEDSIEVLCLNPYEASGVVEQFRKTFTTPAMPFTMVGNDNACVNVLRAAFNVPGYPTSALIDREGVVCYYTPSPGTLNEFRDLFEYYSTEPYEQKIHFPETEQEVPDVEAPAAAAVASAISSAGLIATYEHYNDKYNWPWVVTEDGKAIRTSNVGKNNSYSIINVAVTATNAQAIAFDYLLSTEARHDEFSVLVDGTPMYTLSGRNNDWKTCYAYVPVKSDGTYTISLAYQKDARNYDGDDCVTVRNMRYCALSEITERTDIIYTCVSGAKTGTHYASYEDFTYSDPATGGDGYYHVGGATGPLVIADLMNPTKWDTKTSAWGVAEGQDLIYDVDGNGTPENYTKDFTQLAQCANSSAIYGKIAVNKTLHDALVALTMLRGGHDRSWLELCSYYKIYGVDPAIDMEDPATGLAAYSAFNAVLNVGSAGYDPATPKYNHVDKKMIIMPRGIWYKFVPETSGVYTIHSVSEVDTYCWILDKNEELIIENDDVDPETFSGTPAEARNFSVTLYLTAGDPYYILVDFNNVDICDEFDFVIDYEGESGYRWQAASAGYYTYKLDEYGEMIPDSMYVADAVEYVMGSDGCYHVGSATGPILYINLCAPSSAIDVSIEDIVKADPDEYYCKWCGAVYPTNAEWFEAHDDLFCPTCPTNFHISRDFGKKKILDLPTAARDIDNKILETAYEYDDGHINHVPMYILDTDVSYTDAQYLTMLRSGTPILFENRKTALQTFIADSKDVTKYPQQAQEYPAVAGGHPGLVAATRDLVEIITDLLIFGDYTPLTAADDAWLMMAHYYLYLGE